MGEIGHLEIGMNNFVVTPVNFLKYNMNIKNLETHGLHPRFLHLLVNIPLLFSVLGIIALWKFTKIMYRYVTLIKILIISIVSKIRKKEGKREREKWEQRERNKKNINKFFRYR